jgi:excisionase family DNA binding protein
VTELTLHVPDELVDAIARRVVAEFAAVPQAEAGGEPWRLLNVEEAAARLGRSTRWVRERAKRGELPSVRLDGGALAFDVEDLRAFARARRVGPDLVGEEAAAGRHLRAVDRGWRASS